MRYLALAMMILMASCAAESGGNECTWVREMIPSEGFPDRWTQSEKRQVVAHNRKVREFCR